MLDVFRRTYGPLHPDEASAEFNLAQLYIELGRPAASEPLVRGAPSYFVHVTRVEGTEHRHLRPLIRYYLKLLQGLELSSAERLDRVREL